MAVGFLSVAVQDEQQAVKEIYSFLVNDIGWTVAEDVTDSPTDRDVVFTSRGEPDTANGFYRYIRLRGTSNNLYLYTYETFVSTISNTGEVSEATYGLVPIANDGRGVFIMVVADLERLVIHVETYNEVRYVGYVGRINSYYNVYQHPYPNLVKGSQSSSYGWYYSAFERNAWMIGPEATQAHYYAIQPIDSTGLSASSVGDRYGNPVLASPVYVRSDADPNKSELVGEPRGVYRVDREMAQHGQFLTIEGAPYVVFDMNDSMLAVGPVAVSGTAPPPLYKQIV